MAGESPAAILVDKDGNILTTISGTVSGTIGLATAISGREGYVADVVTDTTDDFNRLAVSGKVSISPPPPPINADEVVIAADTPLEINNQNSPHDTAYVITSGKTLYVQQIVAGAEGDPTERGSKVEVIFNENGTEHIMERIYVAGFTQFGIYPDTSTARDGTLMVGNAGGTNTLIVRRARQSNSAQEIDAVIRGFEI